MTLSSLIQKGGLLKVATAIPAISATDRPATGRTVARIATVAVASPTTELLAKPTATEADLSRIRTWLASIGETDEGIITELLTRCCQDLEALRYYLGRSNEVPVASVDLADDRVTCRTCANLTADGRCLAAARGEMTGSARRYSPPPDRLQRCEGYQPKPDQADGRPGRERWPFLLR